VQLRFEIATIAVMTTNSKLNATIKKRAGGTDDAAASVKVSAGNYYKAI